MIPKKTYRINSEKDKIVMKMQFDQANHPPLVFVLQKEQKKNRKKICIIAT